ncbi:hypothetical protein AAKU52_003086 [Pedobacter sp. CG_S7]|uniref:sacsin N-terminal ATP-binding-like domain-containing protein n=1 Tax=Pedobacter sp. CG_S7 TaxID=3143930 RepID=UPI003394E98A
MSQQEFISNLFQEKSTYNYPSQAEDAANLLDIVSTDIYSESQRFAYELIQNADDAAVDANNTVHFEFFDHCIIISHNGLPFEERDIIAITSAGSSTKKSDENKTGYKGIGFKSVFGKSKRVTIFSGGYQFRFDKDAHKTMVPWQIIPIWTELAELSIPVQKSLIKNQFTVTTVLEFEETNSFYKDLEELVGNGQILLFLRKINKISISKNGNELLYVEKKIIFKSTLFNEVVLFKDSKEISAWVIKTFEQIEIDSQTKLAIKSDPKTPEKLKAANFTEISFAAKVENEQIKQLMSSESLIFTYLPTKVSQFNFPFLVNGNFLTTAAREGLHEDRAWNQWLMEVIAEKIIDWIAVLASSKFERSILSILPEKFVQNGNPLKKCFNLSFGNAIRTKEFVPTAQGLKKVSEIIIDNSSLSDLNFLSEIICEYIAEKENKDKAILQFANSNLFKRYKLKKIGAIDFDEEGIVPFLKSPVFKRNFQVQDNYALIEFFFKFNDHDFHNKLKDLPFIFAKGRKLKAPKEVCFPTKEFITSHGKQGAVILESVYRDIVKNPDLKLWLEKLGIEEPSDIAYVEREIINNIATYITGSNWFETTNFLFELHQKGELSDGHYEKLQHLKLLTKGGRRIVSAVNCYLPDYYNPRVEIESFYNKEDFYISEMYCVDGSSKILWRDFFIKIGVAENIDYKEHKWLSRSNSGECNVKFFDQHKGMDYHPWYTQDSYHVTFNYYNINKISFIELAEDFDFSKIFWKQVLQQLDLSKFNQGFHGYWGDNSEPHNRKESYNKWVIDNMPVIPTTLGLCKLASETFINDDEIMKIAGDFLPVLSYEGLLPAEWNEILRLKQKLELEDYLVVLEGISKDYKAEQQSKNKKQVGLIYTKIASEIPKYTNKKKKQLQDWALNVPILSKQGSFELAAELFYIKVPKFTVEAQEMKTVYLPDSNMGDSNIDELFRLFGVQIIDDFLPRIISPIEENQLKLKLQAIAPYISLIVATKESANFEDVFKEMTNILSLTHLYECTEISLAFVYQSEKIKGPSVKTFIERNNIYFVGKWNSPMTLYSLIPEIANLLGIKDEEEEIRLALQSTIEEFKDWLTQVGIDYSIIPEKAIKQSQAFSEKYSRNLTPIIQNELSELLHENNISIEQLKQILSDHHNGLMEENISFPSSKHLEQKGKNEENRVARELVYKRLLSEGYEFTGTSENNSVINGVYKDSVECPLVVKSYKNSSYKFNIRPNEWLQLCKPNAMFWVHRGNQNLEVLNIEGLLRANSQFHVQFETSTFSFDALVKFAEVFRFVKNVYFQLDSPNFTAANSSEIYIFNGATGIVETGGDVKELMH